MNTFIYVLIWVVAFFLIIVPCIIAPPVLYVVLLVRTSKNKWARKPIPPKDKEMKEMFFIGMDWAKKYEDCKKEVDIQSGKYHLYGEYFDFGYDKAALIIAGRTETLLYSYYFAEPYRASGYNILVIDNRSHGRSDGVLNSLGYKEHKDILAWCRYLHDELNNRQIFMHSICIGASNALFALTSDECPDYLQGMTSEGMFLCFNELMYQHIKETKQPIYPALAEIRGYIKLFTGYDIKKDGPVFRIHKLKRPILMLQSKEDKYALPEKALTLYNTCKSPKRLIYFEKGAHSHIKINAPEKYDKAIIDFLKDICDNKVGNNIINSQYQ